MYKKLYKEIIDAAKLENRTKKSEIYYELHHIVPEFMFKQRKRKGPTGHLDGNPNSVDNLVLLTFQEHLMAHYYLYEILKNTRYEYSAGTALQFFFVKAIGGHIRQRTLSEVDKNFLDEMSHLRKIGIESISKARSGKMPVVDAITREKIGSIAIDHPKVISGEWVHHSKGVKQTWEPRSQVGEKNGNYKKMTAQHLDRIFQCVEKSLIDGTHFSVSRFSKNIKLEFIEFKKISIKWVMNNLFSIENLVSQYNQKMNAHIIYDPYYRSVSQRTTASKYGRMYTWVTNGTKDLRILKSNLSDFLNTNTEYKNGRINA
jgi:hypothetical protein